MVVRFLLLSGLTVKLLASAASETVLYEILWEVKVGTTIPL